ncbi:hypothetical protein O6H91_18G052800 [Diphasiastrum complanatum]|uniref:Uncharacterized protein n=2 Tax=Diphasiastrum complanatum TaxID=34168 RepID=A0ACC2B2G4_DIPCM|nr:hypothetical protein O6H91_18G052800 [Diphasiastrum complanatum]KAJ7523525.1 hypothetical protein O6H91_18G052800 [Diphasiastrum complanatum]
MITSTQGILYKASIGGQWMIRSYRIFFWLLILHSTLGVTYAQAFQNTSSFRDSQLPLTRIAFGSCSNQSAPQPIWTAILDFRPQLFIWLGDNIYADSKRPMKFFGKERTAGPWKNVPRFIPATEEEMAKMYNEARNIPGYLELKKTAQVIGTWDDHDYGLNNAGKEFSGKKASQKLMLDFLEEPHDSLRRVQEGVYTSYLFGPSGKQIKVVLLDTRYHRDSPFTDGTILGETQWKWLEKELSDSTAQVHLIASSIQVLGNFSATIQPLFLAESWSNFPKERKRLFNLLSALKVRGIIFISGDVHFGEINRYDCAIGSPLYDVTSSGLTQAIEQTVPSFLAIISRFAAWLMPTTMRVYNSACRYKSCVYGKQNFGTLEIDWSADPVTIHAEVRDVLGKSALSQNITLAELQTENWRDNSGLSRKVTKHCTLEVDLPSYSRYILAFSFFSSVTASMVVLILALYSFAILTKRRSYKKLKPY